MSKVDSKIAFRQNEILIFEIYDNEIIDYSKDIQKSKLKKNFINILKHEVRKRMLKSRTYESDTLIKNNRRSILTNHQQQKMQWGWYFLWMKLLMNLWIL